MQNIFFTILITPLPSAPPSPLLSSSSSVFHFPLQSKFSANGNCHQSRYSPTKGISGQSSSNVFQKQTLGTPSNGSLEGLRKIQNWVRKSLREWEAVLPLSCFVAQASSCNQLWLFFPVFPNCLLTLPAHTGVWACGCCTGVTTV